MFKQIEQNGLEPFDVMGMGAEGHRNPRFAVRADDVANLLLRKANLAKIKLPGGVDAVWAADLERYLKESSP